MSAAYCRTAPGDPVHGPYHDTEHGFPTEDERVLFERLMLKINQAGLSWSTILKKRAGFRTGTRLFRRTFRFTGGQIVGEFLMSIGYLPGAHEPDCPVFARILECAPPWASGRAP